MSRELLEQDLRTMQNKMYTNRMITDWLEQDRKTMAWLGSFITPKPDTRPRWRKAWDKFTYHAYRKWWYSYCAWLHRNCHDY